MTTKRSKYIIAFYKKLNSKYSDDEILKVFNVTDKLLSAFKQGDLNRSNDFELLRFVLKLRDEINLSFRKEFGLKHGTNKSSEDVWRMLLGQDWVRKSNELFWAYKFIPWYNRQKNESWRLKATDESPDLIFTDDDENVLGIEDTSIQSTLNIDENIKLIQERINKKDKASSFKKTLKGRNLLTIIIKNEDLKLAPEETNAISQTYAVKEGVINECYISKRLFQEDYFCKIGLRDKH